MKRILEENNVAPVILPPGTHIVTLNSTTTRYLKFAPFGEHWVCCLVNEKQEELWQRFFYPRKNKILAWGYNEYNGILGAFRIANDRLPRDVEEAALAYVMARISNKQQPDGTLPEVLEPMNIHDALFFLEAIMQREERLKEMEARHKEELRELAGKR